MFINTAATRIQRSVHSRRSQQTPRMNHLTGSIGFDSPTQPLELSRLEVHLLGLSSASFLSCVTTCHSIHTRHQSKNHLSAQFPFASPLPFLPLPFLPCYPFPGRLSVARCPSVLTCHEPCAAPGHQRFSVPVSFTLARRHTRSGESHDSPRQRLSRDPRKLLARVPSRLPPKPLVGTCGNSVLGNVFLPRCKHR